MTAYEAIQIGLTIKKDLYAVSLADFRYHPKEMLVSELDKLINIDRTTLIGWINSGKVQGSKYPYKIDLHSFVTYVLYHYRYKKMNGNAGKWGTSIKDRTPMAMRIRKCRGQIEHA